MRADRRKTGQRDGARSCAPDSSDVGMGFAHALASPPYSASSNNPAARTRTDPSAICTS